MAVKKPHTLIIAGCGPGSPDYVTPAVHSAVSGAEVLVGARRLLELFPESGAEKIVMATDVEEILQEIEKRRDTKRIVILVTGDPGISSLARPVLKRFGISSCCIIPGISSVQTAFSRVGLDWTDARILDTHGKDPAVALDQMKNEGKIAVLGGGDHTLSWIGRLAAIMGGSYRIFFCEDLTLPEERVREVRMDELASISLSSRTIALLIREDFFP
ncbi:MAG: Cobalt-precorrin-7 C(5)-methyltransferase [Syntrophus sp. SKADARSKE-3]|nr:Cobalt-precorrin-7 C(5)-methyltransferase [Syntrophus sp. SKADARSKE-3]